MANRRRKIVSRRMGLQSLQNQQESSSSSRSETIVNSNKTTPKKTTSPKINLKQKISSILVEFKEDPDGKIDPFAKKIMKVFDEFVATQRTNGQNQPSSSGLGSSGSPKTPVSITQTTTKTSTTTTTTIQTNSENDMVLTPRLMLNREIEDARCSGIKAYRELRRLMPSNGYVIDEPVRRSKRTVKPVIRFGDIDFGASKVNSVQRSSRESVFKKTIQKKAVHVKKTPTQNSITIHKQTMSLTQSGSDESSKLHFMKKINFLDLTHNKICET